MAANRTTKRKESPAVVGGAATPPAPRRLRLPLRTVDEVKAEMARLYRSAKAREVAVADASRLANILALLGRLIEGADFERRIAALEDERGHQDE